MKEEFFKLSLEFRIWKLRFGSWTKQNPSADVGWNHQEVLKYCESITPHLGQIEDALIKPKMLSA